MKFCVDCKYHQLDKFGRHHECLREWHDPVTGTPLDRGGFGPPRCIDLRVTTCVNPTSSAFCGPGAVGFEEKPQEDLSSECIACKGTGQFVRQSHKGMSSGACYLCGGTGRL